MKKIRVLLVMAVLMLSVYGCGMDKESGESQTEKKKIENTQENDTEEKDEKDTTEDISEGEPEENTNDITEDNEDENVGEDNPEENLPEDSQSLTVEEKIVEYYMNTYEPDGQYVIFDNENYESEDWIVYTVRYQISDAEAQEILDAGDVPLANIYTTSVSYNKSTGEYTDDWGQVLPIE